MELVYFYTWESMCYSHKMLKRPLSWSTYVCNGLGVFNKKTSDASSGAGFF